MQPLNLHANIKDPACCSKTQHSQINALLFFFFFKESLKKEVFEIKRAELRGYWLTDRHPPVGWERSRGSKRGREGAGERVAGGFGLTLCPSSQL